MRQRLERCRALTMVALTDATAKAWLEPSGEQEPSGVGHTRRRAAAGVARRALRELQRA
jgi:hypothetical protein